MCKHLGNSPHLRPYPPYPLGCLPSGRPCSGHSGVEANENKVDQCVTLSSGLTEEFKFKQSSKHQEDSSHRYVLDRI